MRDLRDGNYTATWTNAGIAAVFLLTLFAGEMRGQTISAVVFSGTVANPTISILGTGFNPAPAPTYAAYGGTTGYDYGTQLHIQDTYFDSGFSFDAGYVDFAIGRYDFMGLVLLSYTDTLIQYQPGSYYSSFGYQIRNGDSFTVYVKGASVSGTVHYGCPVNMVLYFGFPGVSDSGRYMVAQATAPPSPTSFSAIPIADYAKACGFDNFNWQQELTNLPSGNMAPANPALIGAVNKANDGSLVASPSSVLYDPPPGGYCVPNDGNSRGQVFPCTDEPATDNTAPFYYPAFPLTPPAQCTVPNDLGACPPFPNLVSSDDTTLSFLDAPLNNLPGVAATSNPEPGTFVSFSSSLVGVSSTASQGSMLCGASSQLYCTSLYSWSWNSTFNGQACNAIYSLLGLCPGVSRVTSQEATIYPIIPGSGTGGITITSINDVQLPPAVSPSQITTTASGLAYSRVSQTFNGTVTLSNISSSAISGPLQILFFGIPANVTLVQATGNLSGTPYLTVPVVASLTPGQSVTVGVQFKNPSDATINLSPVLYSGSIN